MNLIKYSRTWQKQLRTGSFKVPSMDEARNKLTFRLAAAKLSDSENEQDTTADLSDQTQRWDQSKKWRIIWLNSASIRPVGARRVSRNGGGRSGASSACPLISPMLSFAVYMLVVSSILLFSSMFPLPFFFAPKSKSRNVSVESLQPYMLEFFMFLVRLSGVINLPLFASNWILSLLSMSLWCICPSDSVAWYFARIVDYLVVINFSLILYWDADSRPQFCIDWLLKRS